RGTASVSSNPVDAAALFRLLLVGAVGAILVSYMVTRQVDLLQSMTRGVFVLLFVFVVVHILSASWSVKPMWTLYRSFEFAVDAALIAVISTRFRTSEDVGALFNWTWLLHGILLLTVGVGVLFAPSEALPKLGGAIGFGIQGVMPVIARNTVGHLSAILFLVAFTRLLMNRPGRSGYLLLLAGTTPFLLLAQTRSVLIPIAFALPVILLCSRRFFLLIASIGGLLAALLLGGVPALLLEYLNRGRPESDIATLTGRTTWWELAFDRLSERPLTGYGGYTGGRFVVGQNFDEDLATVHNTYLEVLIGTSFWGLVPIVLLVLIVWYILGRNLIYHMRFSRNRSLEWCLTLESTALMTLITVRSFLSSSTLIWHPSLEFLVIVAFVEAVRRRPLAVTSGSINKRNVPWLIGGTVPVGVEAHDSLNVPSHQPFSARNVRAHPTRS
ncbi:MAG: O-antigen ligase family protein, partial [Chloroflexota bacterium]|nr:O-antigen ligase family protein [Chloroflexota bacterium]